MGILDRLRKKKVEEAGEEKAVEVKEKAGEMSDLEKACMGDKEVYEALRGTMLLDPRKVELSLKDVAEKAKDFEKQKDTIRARMWYGVAGGLAIYEGDVENVKKYFGKCAELSSDRDYTILKIPEKAVSKAQEYYKKHLKG